MISNIILAASLITALGVIIALISKVFNWFDKQGKQDEYIKELQSENALICYALSACLDGLEQLGANHTVPIAKLKLEKFLNKRAHHLNEK